MTKIKVEVIVDRDLKPLNNSQKKVIEQFTKYKEISIGKTFNNFITPPVGTQMTYPSDHISFGRDTEFEKPQHLINDIFEYNLSKVHVDTKASWKPTDTQWKCSSNESVVYSGFKVNGSVKLVVIGLLIDDGSTPQYNAHHYYKDGDIDTFLDIAHENREDVLNESEE